MIFTIRAPKAGPLFGECPAIRDEVKEASLGDSWFLRVLAGSSGSPQVQFIDPTVCSLLRNSLLVS